MGKNVNPKPSSKTTAQSSTPVTTRGASKNQQNSMTHNNSHTSNRSNSLSSTDRFELLEKKLLKDLAQVIAENFEHFEERISYKIQEIVSVKQAEINELAGEVKKLKNELATVQKELNDMRRISRSADAIITGIPQCANENPQQLISTISAKINHSLSPYTVAFRPKTSGRQQQGKGAPIVVKFSSTAEQRGFIYKFKKFGAVTLNAICSNFASDSRVNAFESLTKTNNNILRAALRLQREGQLSSVFTRYGEIYVRIKRDDAPIVVTTLEELMEIFAEGSIAEA